MAGRDGRGQVLSARQEGKGFFFFFQGTGRQTTREIFSGGRHGKSQIVT